jgi:hypothetical protein
MRPRANVDRFDLEIVSIERIYHGIISDSQRQDLLKQFGDSAGITLQRASNFDFDTAAISAFRGLGFIKHGWQNDSLYAIAGPLTRGNATQEGTLVIGIASKGAWRRNDALTAERFCRAEKLRVD